LLHKEKNHKKKKKTSAPLKAIPTLVIVYLRM